MKLYIGNKMSGVPYFNAPWFDQAADELMRLPIIEAVFNPAQHDRDMGFEPLDCPSGSSEEARAAGFDPRVALRADWTWIATHSSGLVIGPDWRTSPGTISEIACHQALRLPVWEFGTFMRCWDADYLPRLALAPIMELGVVPDTFLANGTVANERRVAL